MADGTSIDADIFEPELIIRRRPPIKLDLNLDPPDDPYRDVRDVKLQCVICGGDTYLVGHHNLVIDDEARVASIQGTSVINCYHCRAAVPGLRVYGPQANVSARDWGNLSLAKALVRAISSGARHG